MHQPTADHGMLTHSEFTCGDCRADDGKEQALITIACDRKRSGRNGENGLQTKAMSGSSKKRRNGDRDRSETPMSLAERCTIGAPAKGNASGAFTLGESATSTSLLKARHIDGLGNRSSFQRSTLLRSDDLIAFEGLQRAIEALGWLDAKFSGRK
tara:strand:- start:251 stop:715 length:465 start_codon:yes stop_codon:yes gene_type:complete